MLFSLVTPFSAVAFLSSSDSEVNTITYVVIALFLVVVLGFFALIILRLVSSKIQVAEEKKKEELRPLVYDLLTSDRSPKDIVATLGTVIARKDRGLLEAVLLENARVLKGREQDILTDAFDKLGFADEDIATVKQGEKIKKAESAFHLGTMRIARATPYLIEAMSSPSPEVRFSCLNALSKIGTPDAIDAVMEHLATDEGLETLRVAEVILERKQSFIPGIEKLLEESYEERERLLLLIDLLGAMRESSAVTTLLRYLDHHDPDVRAKSANALGSIGDFTACEALVRSMGDQSPGVRAEAAESLGKLQCDNAISRLKAGLSDVDLTVKMNSAVALSMLGDEGHVALEEGLAATEEQERTVVAEVLSREEVSRGGSREGE